MKKVPKSFQLGGHQFEVSLVEEEEMGAIVKAHGMSTECYGFFLPDTLKIYLIKPSKILKLSVVLQSFWHEYAHALLWVMGDKRWKNELYVDQMGHMLHQTHQTCKFKI